MYTLTELLYRVNENDSVVGEVDRDYAHSNGILHRSGIVFLSRSDRKILIQNRSSLKQIFPGRHDCSSSFHVKFGETYLEAAQRELNEETGVSATPTYVGKFLHRDPPENQIVAVFYCTSDQPVMIDNGEASGAYFCSRDEVDGMVYRNKVTPWLREGWKIVRNRI